MKDNKQAKYTYGVRVDCHSLTLKMEFTSDDLLIGHIASHNSFPLPQTSISLPLHTGARSKALLNDHIASNKNISPLQAIIAFPLLSGGTENPPQEWLAIPSSVFEALTSPFPFSSVESFSRIVIRQKMRQLEQYSTCGQCREFYVWTHHAR